ncbi:MAG: terminase small subunit [Desulfurivibrionaceae bacterium]|jgi:phage terminase small subunit
MGLIPIGNPKWQRFVEEYMVDLDPRKASVRAGYEETNATKTGKALLSRPAVQAAVRAAIEARSALTRSSAASVIESLEEIVRRCMDPDDKRFKPSEAIRALELLGKHHGAFERDNQQKATVIRIISNV